MAKTLDDALKVLKARAAKAGPRELESFRALDEHFTLTAKELDAARKALGVSQRELAHKARVDQGDLSRILAGKTDPRWSTVRRLVSTLRTMAPKGAKRAPVAAYQKRAR